MITSRLPFALTNPRHLNSRRLANESDHAVNSYLILPVGRSPSHHHLQSAGDQQIRINNSGAGPGSIYQCCGRSANISSWLPGRYERFGSMITSISIIRASTTSTVHALAVMRFTVRQLFGRKRKAWQEVASDSIQTRLQPRNSITQVR